MSNWMKYPELERHERMKNEGREVLGLEVLVTEKRDGENVSIWFDGKTFHISSRNLEVASHDIITRLISTKEWSKVCGIVQREKTDFGQDLIVYGELMKPGWSPTRIEGKRKKPMFIIFDIFDVKAQRFLDYDRVYQYAYQWKVPIVKALGSFNPKEIRDLEVEIAKWKAWCKRHKREGVVMKAYSSGQRTQQFFKEKIDLPDLRRHKVRKPEGEILPPMPEDRLLRALQHAYDEVGVQWAEPKITMPVIAKHIQAEAREHNFEPPRNFFKIYKETPLDKIRNNPDLTAVVTTPERVEAVRKLMKVVE